MQDVAAAATAAATAVDAKARCSRLQLPRGARHIEVLAAATTAGTVGEDTAFPATAGAAADVEAQPKIGRGRLGGRGWRLDICREPG